MTASPQRAKTTETATRLIGIATALDHGGVQAHTIPVCDEHAAKYLAKTSITGRSTAADLLLLPRAIEADEAHCADCVRNAGFTYAVHLRYFKDSGKFADQGSYLTTLTAVYEIVAEVRQMLLARQNPGLVDGAVLESGYATLVTIPAHPGGYPHLIHRP